jgi:hypothetical protein
MHTAMTFAPRNSRLPMPGCTCWPGASTWRSGGRAAHRWEARGVRRAGAFLIWCVALPLHQT